MPDVAVIGSGLAGLACACQLSALGYSCQVLEASDGVGGRARSDVVDGFVLDRGFQVMLTAYPEAQRQLNYGALQLLPFAPGALVRFEGRFRSVVDPWRRPAAVLSGLVSPIGSLRDKLKIANLRRRVTKPSLEELFQSDEVPTIDFLREYGFSPKMIERFFRPFFSGIFLERELQTSSHIFEFVFRMFSLGNAVLPAAGMGAIAQQLASRLPEGCVRLHQKAVKIAGNSVILASGEEVSAKTIVVATDNASAAQLLPEIIRLPSRSTTCFYFAAEKAPIPEPILVLNGEGRGPVNNLCVPSMVAPSYAPAGSHLVSVSAIGKPSHTPERLRSEVLSQLSDWFGKQVDGWRPLRSYWIPDALPEQLPASGGIGPRDSLVRPGLYICGDHRDTASINGALLSVRRTAEAIQQSLQ